MVVWIFGAGGRKAKRRQIKKQPYAKKHKV